MSLFDKNIPVLTGTRWQTLAIATGLTTAAGLGLLALVATFGRTINTMLLTAFIIGIVLTILSAVLTIRARYELVPQPMQVVGSCVIGLANAYALVVTLYILGSAGVATLLLLGVVYAAALVPNTIGIKLSRHKRLYALQWAGLAFVFGGLYISLSASFAEPLSATLPLLALSIPGVAVIAEFASRTCNAAVLSPWVNGFWTGVVMVIGAVLAAPFLIRAEALEITTLINMPIWIGVAVAVLGVAAVGSRLFLQKLKMAEGYMVYKQSLALAVLLLTLAAAMKIFTGGALTAGELVGAVLFLAGYGLIERRIGHVS